MLVAIDIGGTFTDLMAFDEATGRFSQAKTLTTPAELVRGIIDRLDRSGVDVGRIGELIQGSTTAIKHPLQRLRSSAISARRSDAVSSSWVIVVQT